ncbi:MAG: Phosphoserine phosphatase RsbU [Pseudomonadota bacterium]|jgi:hypothetical protein
MRQTGGLKMISCSQPLSSLLLVPILSMIPSIASAAPQRSLLVRSVGVENETHVNIRVSAFESDQNGIFPISTLDKNSFQLSLNGHRVPPSSLGLVTFDASRRKNNRAVVWAYDATGVKTMKGLNKELRALSAQEFAGFNADFLSILGVASDRTIERIILDPQQQDNTLALQRRLLGDPVGLTSASVFRDSALCVAADKFEKWASAGLKSADQKSLILLGGAIPATGDQLMRNNKCAERLTQMQVIVHQIIFARPETFVSRHWSRQTEILAQGGVFRVVDLQGAFRALQSIRNILDKEYSINAQIPATLLEQQGNPELHVAVTADYHGQQFNAAQQRLQIHALNRQIITDQPAHPAQRPSPPPRMHIIDQRASLAINAWIEWLATSVLIGGVVTLRHMRRMRTGVDSLEEESGRLDSSQGPLLMILNGKDKGREFRIRQNKVTLGRGFNCDIRLNARHIRRRHGCISFQGDKALIEDFSDGQLLVNGRPLRNFRVIGHGSVLQLGELQLLFRCGEV